MNSVSIRSALPRTIVTGSTSGLGWALSMALIDAGVPVVAIGRHAGRLQELEERGGNVATYRADLRDIDQLPGLMRSLVTSFPDVGCLVNNAGIQHELRLDDESLSISDSRDELTVNLLAPIVMTQALLPHLCRQPQARIVNVTSVLAYAPKRSAAVYSASKAGLRNFSDALRVQLSNTSCRVQEVVLPLVDTPMTAGRGAAKMSAPDAARAVLAGMVDDADRILVGKARAAYWLSRWAPSVLARVVQRG